MRKRKLDVLDARSGTYQGWQLAGKQPARRQNKKSHERQAENEGDILFQLD
jgi:hypothetical protein